MTGCPPPEPTVLQRCNGTLELTFDTDETGITRLADLHQRDPCRAMFPQYEADDIKQAVLVTTSGGLTGGDRLAISIAAEPGARAFVTTQAAEKIYRSTGALTEIAVSLRLAEGAWLEWLPQETILFEGARFRRDTAVHVRRDARLIAGEIVVFGRIERGERLETARYFDRWRLYRDDALLWADALSLSDSPQRALGHPAGFGGAVAAALVVFAAPDDAAFIDRARTWIGGSASRGAVTVVNGLLVARFLGNSTAELRGDVARYWCALRAAAATLPSQLPRTWYT